MRSLYSVHECLSTYHKSISIPQNKNATRKHLTNDTLTNTLTTNKSQFSVGYKAITRRQENGQLHGVHHRRTGREQAGFAWTVSDNFSVWNRVTWLRSAHELASVTRLHKAHALASVTWLYSTHALASVDVSSYFFLPNVSGLPRSFPRSFMPVTSQYTRTCNMKI